MNIVIIEDEEYTAEDLERKVKTVLPNATIQAKLMSVKQAIDYFQTNDQPDLFFSDIQLGDGLSFEIFKAIKTSSPVIFITAFDEYALKAFRANGIDYILKPFELESIQNAIKKYTSFTTAKTEGKKIDDLLNYLQANQPKQSTILVYQKDKIIPIKASEIALFYSENEIVKVVCFDGKRYTTNSTLDELAKRMGDDFHRANRQFIVNRKSIKDVSQYFGRKLTVNLLIEFPEKIIVSKEKSSSLLEWLEK